jgi:predicted ATP-grasp superfamily ATP-dependent carboligase
MSGVILTNARHWSTLAAARCLGRHGIKVACGEEEKLPQSFFPPAACSRYCRERFTYPHYETEPESFIKAICSFANKHKEYDVLMPVAEETCVIAKHISAIRSSAPHLRIPLHEYKYIEIANDKRMIVKIAERIGIPTPRTYVPSSLEEVERIGESIRYPAVVKLPALSGSRGMAFVENKERLISTYMGIFDRYNCDDQTYPFIQERISGNRYETALLYKEGHVLAQMTHRSIRELPPGIGPSVVRISERQQEVELYARKLLEELHWHGMATVEFILDANDGRPKIMEVNPRFWGSLYQAIAAGVDFPYLLYRMAVEEPTDPVTGYVEGIRTRCLGRDLEAFPSYFRNADNKLKFLLEFLNLSGSRYDDLSITDPLPFLAIPLNALIRRAKTGRWTAEVVKEK